MKALNHQIKPLSIITNYAHCIKFNVNAKAQHVHVSKAGVPGLWDKVLLSELKSEQRTTLPNLLMSLLKKKTAVELAEALGIAYLIWGACGETDAMITGRHLITPTLKCHVHNWNLQQYQLRTSATFCIFQFFCNQLAAPRSGLFLFCFCSFLGYQNI